MPIRLEYEKKEDLPEAFQADEVFKELFTEDDGKIKLTGVVNLKTDEDVENVKEALRKERDEHAKTKAKLSPWSEMDPEETKKQLDRIPALEKASEGALDEKQIEQQINERLERVSGPLNKQIEDLINDKNGLETKLAELNEISQRAELNDLITDLAVKTKAHSTAIDDMKSAAAAMLVKDETGKWVTKSGLPGIHPGLGTDEWGKDMKKARPHWWPDSTGAGSQGGSGGSEVPQNNPWTKDHFNLTEQGRILKTDPELAKRFKSEAA